MIQMHPITRIRIIIVSIDFNKFLFSSQYIGIIRDKAPADSNNSYIIRPHCKNNSIDVNSFEWYSGYIYVSNSNDFKGLNVKFRPVQLSIFKHIILEIFMKITEQLKIYGSHWNIIIT